MKRKIILILLLHIQSCIAFYSPVFSQDTIKTEVKKSKFAVVFGIGLVGGTRLGVRYNFNNYISAELSYSSFNMEGFFSESYPLQIGSILNYKPFKKLGFTTSLSFSYSKPQRAAFVRYLIVPNIGYILNYNKKGIGGFIRIGEGYIIKSFDYGDFKDKYSNLDIGIFYNF